MGLKFHQSLATLKVLAPQEILYKLQNLSSLLLFLTLEVVMLLDFSFPINLLKRFVVHVTLLPDWSPALAFAQSQARAELLHTVNTFS